MDYCTIEEAWGSSSSTPSPPPPLPPPPIIKPMEMDPSSSYYVTKSEAEPSTMATLEKKIQEIQSQLDSLVQKMSSFRSPSDTTPPPYSGMTYVDLLFFLFIGIFLIFILDFIYRWSKRSS